MKLYKGLECPLDGYEIVQFSLSGPDGKTYALCPFCYNNPPFEGAHKVIRCPILSLLANNNCCQADENLDLKAAPIGMPIRVPRPGAACNGFGEEEPVQRSYMMYWDYVRCR